MDEVDNIIVHSLKSIGCSVDEKSSLHTFTPEQIYEAVHKCVEMIKGQSIGIPKSLPPGMSQRFRVGSSLASIVTDIGYTGEMGYQTFLYANESDIRKVLMFLVDKLPRDTRETGGEATEIGQGKNLKNSVAAAFGEQLKKVWLPPVCSQRHNYSQPFRGCDLVTGGDQVTRKLTGVRKNYYENQLPFIFEQTLNSRSLCSALIEDNVQLLTTQMQEEMRLHSGTKKQVNKAEKLAEIKSQLLEERNQQLAESTEGHRAKSEAPTLETKPNKEEITPDESSVVEEKGELTEEEILAKNEVELDNIRQTVEQVTARIAKIHKNMDKVKVATDETEREIEEKKKTTEEEKKNYQIKKKTLAVLPESNQTIAKLQQAIDGADEKMVGLQKRWEEHKEPLTNQIVELKREAEMRQTGVEQKLAEIQQFKQQMKSATEDVKVKDQMLKQLNVEFDNMTKDANRSSYTKRILEIVGNIKKQKHDIDNVLAETKAIQKDINTLSGKLDRTFTVTDELIFRDAKRDDSVKAAYKYLASLHDNCSAVIREVEETGFILREIRELEDQIDQENSKNTDETLAKILSDYKMMKKENQAMINKLKQ